MVMGSGQGWSAESCGKRHDVNRAGDDAGASGDELPGRGIYIHWPFCKAKCPYCDFNSHVRGGVDHDRWRRALVRELEHGHASGFAGPVQSVFFGGGTPSLMQPETVAAIVARIGKLWTVASNVEITLEANPTSVEAGKFRGFRDAGVNRVSLGVQSLNDAALRFLGREHDAREAIRAVELALATFDRVSIDLIYARAGQSRSEWLAELDAATALGTRHLSLYQLTIEPGTRFHALHGRGVLPVMGDEEQAALFEATRHHMRDRGFSAYEVSNFAQAGEESRHNLVYWRYGDYLGIGPGAHGRLSLGNTRLATRTIRQPDAWLSAVEASGHGEEPRDRLDRDVMAMEALMMGLRLDEGIPLERLERLAGRPRDELFDRSALDRAFRSGWVTLCRDGKGDDRLRATDSGILILDRLLADISR